MTERDIGRAISRRRAPVRKMGYEAVAPAARVGFSPIAVNVQREHKTEVAFALSI